MFSRIQSHPIYQMMFNPSFKKNQLFEVLSKYGSKNLFSTDCYINGEYFRSRSNNQYFCVVDKNIKLCEVHKHVCDFRELEEAIKIRSFNPEKHNILRLEFMNDKKYFVESYQAIDIENPDVTLMTYSLEELRNITPKFEPLPDQEYL